MLSDEGSKTITAWGLLNKEATGSAAGIPHPGTFIIDPSGVIVSRTFEQPYTERRSAASILAELSKSSAPGASVTIEGQQVTLTLSASDAIAAPGRRISLFVQVAPGPKMHVYAPGQRGYIPIRLSLDADPAYRAHEVRYPPSRPYVFVPLNETVQVYEESFRLTQDVTLALTQDVRRRAVAGETLSLKGALEYQACDDKVCYRPETLPLEWKLKLTPIVGR